jgi:hypothetical protein
VRDTGIAVVEVVEVVDEVEVVKVDVLEVLEVLVVELVVLTLVIAVSVVVVLVVVVEVLVVEVVEVLVVAVVVVVLNLSSSGQKHRHSIGQPCKSRLVTRDSVPVWQRHCGGTQGLVSVTTVRVRVVVACRVVPLVVARWFPVERVTDGIDVD